MFRINWQLETRLNIEDLTNASYTTGQQVLSRRSANFRKSHGQFFTPPQLARFAVNLLGTIEQESYVLDPALGSGTLVCALIDQVISNRQPKLLWIDGYEIDSELCGVARSILEKAVERAKSVGISLHVRIREGDFVAEMVSTLNSPLFTSNATPQKYDYIIANPPYFKLNKNDLRVKAGQGLIGGYTNIYTMFMAISLRILKRDGRACFIVPRSFCSGAYFSSFRRGFLEDAIPRHVHLFEMRDKTFKDDDVLQENVVVSFERKDGNSEAPDTYDVVISSSQDVSDLERRKEQSVSAKHFIGKHGNSIFFRLPTSELDKQLVEIVDSWSGTLDNYDLVVSTGPVVPFRAVEFLREAEERNNVPLLWLYHVRPHSIQWPLSNNGKNKPQWILASNTSRSLLVPNTNYVLLRRFSAKEEARRLVAAPLLSERFEYSHLGFENHLNYIHSKDSDLSPEIAIGLSALYNSALLDRYFRIVNGNTQVNATELRAMPLPTLEVISILGRRDHSRKASLEAYHRELFVLNTLKEFRFLPSDFPIINGIRGTWEN